MPRQEERSARRIYVGNIPPDIREDDVRDKFKKYGHIEYIDLKSRGGGPVFAFVDYEDARDAEDAVRARDGYSWDGHRLRVEFPRGVGPRGPGGVPVAEMDRYGGSRGDRGGGPGGPRRSRYRCYVSGLPQTGSWQDLKDHLRNAGEICYADVFRDGTGVVEFARHEDLKTALRKFDDTKFRSHGGETSYIRLKEEQEGGRDRSGSRTPPRTSRRSPSYGRDRDRGGSRDRSASPVRDRRRKDSRSRSFSR